MWEAYKLYLLAFLIYTITAIVTAAMQAAAIRYDESSILAPIATTLSGNFLGGFALVLGILRDDRTAKQRERADKAEVENKKLQEEKEKYRQQYEEEREQARVRVEQASDRAERAESELQRVRAEYDHEIAERLRRLEAAIGLNPPAAADADLDEAGA